SETFVTAGPWSAMGAVFDPPPPALHDVLERARAMESSPIVTVNLWFDRQSMPGKPGWPGMDVPFIGLPARTMQWVFDKRLAFGDDASHVSLVSSGATDVASLTNEAL